MTTLYISFYNERGEITGAIGSDEAGILLNKERAEQPWVDGDWYGKDVYVADGEVRPRPANPARLDGMTLRDLPTPCTIHIGAQAYPCNDTVAELEFEHPGTYTVRVESWPYLDKEFEVENPPR